MGLLLLQTHRTATSVSIFFFFNIVFLLSCWSCFFLIILLTHVLYDLTHFRTYNFFVLEFHNILRVSSLQKRDKLLKIFLFIIFTKLFENFVWEKKQPPLGKLSTNNFSNISYQKKTIFKFAWNGNNILSPVEAEIFPDFILVGSV